MTKICGARHGTLACALSLGHEGTHWTAVEGTAYGWDPTNLPLDELGHLHLRIDVWTESLLKYTESLEKRVEVLEAQVRSLQLAQPKGIDTLAVGNACVAGSGDYAKSCSRGIEGCAGRHDETILPRTLSL